MRNLPRLDTRITKATRDLLAHKGRAALVIVGLALSLWGITTVGTAFWVLRHDLRQNFVGTTPPSLVARTDTLDGARRAEVIAALAALPEIDTAESRPLVAGRVAIGTTWLPMIVSVVEDFEAIRVARFELEEGDWPPADGSLAIERDGLALARFLAPRQNPDAGHAATDPHAGREPAPPLAVGQAIRVRIGGAPAFEVPLVGSVFDPGQAPSRMELALYGYASRATVETWPGAVDGERLLLTVTGDPESETVVRAAALAVDRELERLGVAVRGWVIPDYAHPHAFQMRSVLAILATLGSLAFLLAAVLVYDLVSTLLADQVRQIGILKALGATAGTVARAYLLATSLLGACAAALAVPLGARAGMGLAHAIAGFLNFEILTGAAPVGWLVACVLLGLAHPALAALGPVARAARISVREALVRGESEGVRPLATEAAGAGRLPAAWTLAGRNAFRRRGRLVATVLGLAVGTTVFLAAAHLRSSLLYTAEVVEQTQRHDLRIVLGERVPTETLERSVAELDGVAAVEAWDARSVQLRAHGDVGTEPMSRHALTLLPAATDALAPRMIAGRWLRPGETDAVVVNQKLLADRPDLGLDRPLTLRLDARSIPARVVGVVKEFGPGTVYFDLDGFETLFGPDDGRRIVVVSLTDRSGSARRAMRERLELVIAHSSLDVRRLITTTMAAAIIRSHLDVIAYALGTLGLLLMGVSGMGLVSSLAVSVADRRRELGVLRAIGADATTVRAVLTLEALLIGGLGWAVAVVVSVLINAPLTGLVGRRLVEYPFDPRIAPGGLAAALVLGLGLSIVASLAASRKALRQPVRDVLRVD